MLGKSVTNEHVDWPFPFVQSLASPVERVPGGDFDVSVASGNL